MYKSYANVFFVFSWLCVFAYISKSSICKRGMLPLNGLVLFSLFHLSELFNLLERRTPSIFIWFINLLSFQVGTYFVGQYYQMLQNQPDFVYQFYSDASTMLRVDGNTRESATAMLVFYEQSIEFRLLDMH